MLKLKIHNTNKNELKGYSFLGKINKHRMIIYKNIGRDNIRKKRKENKYFRRCVLIL
jgi:hypothetical protein